MLSDLMDYEYRMRLKSGYPSLVEDDVNSSGSIEPAMSWKSKGDEKSSEPRKIGDDTVVHDSVS